MKEELDCSEEFLAMIRELEKKAKQEGFSLLVSYFNRRIIHFESDGYAAHRPIWDEVPFRLRGNTTLRENFCD